MTTTQYYKEGAGMNCMANGKKKACGHKGPQRYTTPDGERHAICQQHLDMIEDGKDVTFHSAIAVVDTTVKPSTSHLPGMSPAEGPRIELAFRNQERLEQPDPEAPPVTIVWFVKKSDRPNTDDTIYVTKLGEVTFNEGWTPHLLTKLAPSDDVRGILIKDTTGKRRAFNRTGHSTWKSMSIEGKTIIAVKDEKVFRPTSAQMRLVWVLSTQAGLPVDANKQKAWECKTDTEFTHLVNGLRKLANQKLHPTSA